MKQLFIFILLLSLQLNAQSKDTAKEYLIEAKKAAEEYNAEDFEYFMDLYSIYLSNDDITPETIDKEHLELYTDAIYQATYNNLEIPKTISSKTIDFLSYDIENKPMNMASLGYFYHNGLGVAQDHSKAKYWYEKAIEKGDNARAMTNLGSMYHNGEGVSQDYAKAKYWYEKAIEKDYPFAMRNLGILYENGQGVSQDYAKAKYWYEKAADKGNAKAMNSLGLLYKNNQGVSQDYAKAKYWFEKAAERGNEYAMNNLGYMYYNGEGVSQDYVKAKHWYEKGAEKGGADAMTNLGVLYKNGQGVSQDYAKAKYWYEKAADKGEEYAMNNLGILYMNGQGVTRDYSQAKYWYEKAVEKGNADAMANLGILYDYGNGVECDWQQALHWYKKAVEKNNAYGLRALGEFYLFGVSGVSKDENKAIEYFKRAAKLNDEKAEMYLKVLQDIEDKKYHSLSNSESDNKIYITTDDLEELKNLYPWTITKYGARWEINVYYRKNSNIEWVQIFPTYAQSNERPKDGIGFTNYSGSDYYRESEGSHNASIGWRKETGNRAIGYVYYTGSFSNGKEYTIKAPYAVCWLPKKDY